MDYGVLIRDAWSTTWQHRFLWVLGLFTGAAVSTCSGAGNRLWSTSAPVARQPGIGAVSPVIERLAEDVGRSVAANLFLIITAAILLAILWFVVSIIAQGGMTEATVDLAQHQPASLGLSWRAGTHLFWRFLGIAFVPFGLALGLGFVAAIGASLAILTSTLVGDEMRGVVGAFWVLLLLALILCVIAMAIALSITLAYAQRIVVIEHAGVIAAVRKGWLVMRAHLGSSLLTWLINVGLGIGAEVAVGLAVGAEVAVLVGIGFIIWSLAGFGVALAIYAGLGVAVAIATLWGLEGVINTFFWSYWTLAYLRLSGPVAAAGT